MTKIRLYTDGACVPNPGEMGIGGVLIYGNHTKEYSLRLGYGTNNIAEITSITHGIKLIKDKTITVVVVSDSMYAVNILNGKWRAKKNRRLVQSAKELVSEFSDIEFQWVRGHNGDTWNERADELANKDLPEFYYGRK